MSKFMKFLLPGAFLLVVVLVIFNGVVIKTGNVGLMVNHYSGQIDSHIRQAGYNRVSLLGGQEMVEIPTYQRMYTMVRDTGEGSQSGDDSVVVNTLSANTLNVDDSVAYHIESDDPAKIVSLYKKYRNQFVGDDFRNFEDTALRPVFRQAVVDAFGRDNTSHLMGGEGKLAASNYAKDELNQHFNPDGIVIDDVAIRTIYPDDATATSLRTRLQAQQNLRLAKLNQQLATVINQTAVLKAQGDSTATRIRAASLSARLVRFRHIKDITIVGVPQGAIISIPPGEAATTTP